MGGNNNGIEISEFAKNSREVVRVGLSEFKGYKLLQVRSWAKKEGGASVATKNGIALQVHLIAELRAALDEAEAKARELGWLVDGGRK